MDNFSENVEGLANRSSFNEPEYVTYPTINTEDYVANNKEVHEYIQDSWVKQKNYCRDSMNEMADAWIHKAWGVHSDSFATYKRDVQSEVNYMVKEFECKKSQLPMLALQQLGLVFWIVLNFTHISTMRIYSRRSQLSQKVRITV